MAGGVAANPDLAHFGAVMAGLVSAEQPVMLTNCGTGDLTVTGTSFTGITPLEFTVLSPTTFPITIPKTESRTFNVAMTPRSVGPKSAMLVIASDQGPTSVLFDGTGIGGSNSGNAQRETYYACSVGGGSAAWPIGVALLALRRRRRR
jgi:MYXO-CTERM domain-containing protein